MKALLIVLALIELLDALDYEKPFDEFNVAHESLYVILNVSESADEQQIVNSFENLASKFHPGAKNIDRNTAKRNLNIMTAAKELLLDPALKKEYDAILSRLKTTGQKHRYSAEADGIIGIKRDLWLYWSDTYHYINAHCFWHYEGMIWWNCKPACPTIHHHQTSVIGIRDATQKDEYSRDYGKFCMAGVKRYCCRVDHAERFYSGIWKYTGPEGDNRSLTCVFRGRLHEWTLGSSLKEHVPGKCGFLQCWTLHLEIDSVIKEVGSEITGEYCDKVKLFGREATATPGLITFNAEGSQKDYLVKIH